MSGRHRGNPNKACRLKWKKSWDDSGGLEGLPLQLIIMVVIAGVGISIVVAWLTVFSEKPLKDLEIESITGAPTAGGQTLIDKNNNTYTIKIRALNTDQKPMEGVSVTMEGPGVSKIATTNSYGIAKFEGVKPTLGANDALWQITITGQYKSWTVTGPYLGIEG